MKRYTLEQAQEELDKFSENIKSIVLSTVSKDGEPFVSYSPYTQDKEGNFYVFISTAVRHSHNMYATKKAHIMLLQDEQDAKHIYARRRLYFKVDVEKFEADDERFEKVAKLFEAKLGKEASLVRTMSDSRIYKLMPSQGNLVLGFGAAFKIDESNKKILKQNTMNGKAHGATHEEGLENYAQTS